MDGRRKPACGSATGLNQIEWRREIVTEAGMVATLQLVFPTVHIFDWRDLWKDIAQFEASWDSNSAKSWLLL